MTAQLIDGRQLAGTVKNEVRGGIEALLARGGRRPGLAVIRVGDDAASAVMIERCRQQIENPTAEDWDGTSIARTK
jgi:5,10-methylene-tetrahydrofolate dehydrogenase/methenyl tetrahydrofolate cyclohydrolase